MSLVPRLTIRRLMLVVAVAAAILAAFELPRRRRGQPEPLEFPWVKWERQFAPYAGRIQYIHAGDVHNHVIPPRRKWARQVSIDPPCWEVRDVPPETPWHWGPDPAHFPTRPGQDFFYSCVSPPR
jgi:hypothetical protein